MVWGQMVAIASGKPFSPSHTTIKRSRVLRFLISESTRIQYLAPSPSPCSPAQSPRISRCPLDRDRQREVDRPVRHVPVPDLHIHTINKDHRIHRIQRPVLPGGYCLHHPVSNGGNGLFRHLCAVDLRQVRGNLTMGQPLRRQRDHQIINSGESPLTLAHDHRLKRALPIPGHLNLHRASRTGEVAYSTVASSCVITVYVTTPGAPNLGGDLGCGDGVIAQGVCDDGCWHVQNVLADCGRAAAAGGDAEFTEEPGEAFGVHRLSCAAAGEQPAGVWVGGGVHVVSLADPGEQELGVEEQRNEKWR
jgi:hypothetical protein